MSMLLVLVIAILVSTGMGTALLGSIKMALARKLKIDEARIGGLLAVFGFTLIPTMLAAGFLSDKFGRQPVTIGGSLLFAASLVLLAQARAYWMVLLAILTLSAGWAALINVVNPLSQPAFGGSQAFAINLGCFIFGIGSFVTPLGVAFLVRRLELRGTLSLLSISGLVMAALACAAEFPPIAPPKPKEGVAPAGAPAPKDAAKPAASPEAPKGGPATPPSAPAIAREAVKQAPAPGLSTLLGSTVLWLLALALFFYMPAEATMATWATTYVTDKGLKEGSAALLLSAFWLAYTASRLVAALTMPTGAEAIVIYALSIVSLAVWVGVLLCRGRRLAVVLVMAVGVVFGPLYPTLVAVLLAEFDAALQGRAMAIFFTLGGLGCTVIPMLIGAYARRRGVQRAFLLAVVSVAALCFVALMLMRRA